MTPTTKKAPGAGGLLETHTPTISRPGTPGNVSIPEVLGRLSELERRRSAIDREIGGLVDDLKNIAGGDRR